MDRLTFFLSALIAALLFACSAAFASGGNTATAVSGTNNNGSSPTYNTVSPDLTLKSSSSSEARSQSSSAASAGSHAAASSSGGSGGTAEAIGGSVYTARPPVATAYVSPLTASNGTCMGSASAGAQGVAVGLSFGTTWTDVACDRRYNSIRLQALGQTEAAVALMCQDDTVRAAMDEAGTPCPSRRFSGQAR